MAPPRRLDKTQQFLAILTKNFILQTRGRKSLLGIGGWAGLLLQLLLPVAFFFVMYLPKHYIKPTHHGETLGFASIRLESRSWADPYDGPATFPSHGGRARLLLAPDTPDVRGLATVLARGLACPRDPALRVCPVFNLPTNFHCMFMPPHMPPSPLAADAVGNDTERLLDPEPAGLEAPTGGALERLYEVGGEGRLLQRWWRRRRLRAMESGSRAEGDSGDGGIAVASGGAKAAAQESSGTTGSSAVAGLEEDPCADFTSCVSTPACYEHVLRNQIAFAASQEVARQAVKQDPDDVDAIVFFPGAMPGAAAEAAEADSGARAAAHAPAGAGTAGGNGSGGAGAAYERTSDPQPPRGRTLLQQPATRKQQDPAAAVSVGDPLPVRGAAVSAAGSDGGIGGVGAGGISELLGRAVIGMNHTDVPPTGLLLDLFEVVPTRGNGLALYRRYWFFANLQLAINRAVMGVQLAAGLNTTAAGGAAGAAAAPAVHAPAAEAETAVPAAARARALMGARSRGDPAGVVVGSPYDTAVPANVEVSYKPFPWPAVTEDLGAASAAIFFNLLLVYAFLPPTRAVVGDIVREKELRLREGMRVLGLSEPSYWLSWGLTHWLLLALSGALCTAAGTYPFANSSAPLMLAFFWLYAAALVAYSYALSTLFSSSRVAGTATQLLYAVSMLPGFVLPAIYQYGSWTWYVACLSPPSAASLFAAALVNWEKVAEGITPRTLWVPITQANGFSAGTVLLFLALDVALFGLLTWYLDKVLPKSYGQRLPPWFVFDRRYWSARRGGRGGSSVSSSSARHQAGAARSVAGRGLLSALWPKGQRQAAGEEGRGGESTEAAAASHPFLSSRAVQSTDGGGVRSDGLLAGDGGRDPAAVEVHGLVKTFRTLTGGSKAAVDHLDLRIERGRITALLGHNGAGKTTTIHVLTGMLQPTAGSALVNGFDVATQMDQVRASLGICPQFDILWPDLTVYEHLALYGSIKGYPRQELKAVATAAAAGVGLTSKLHAAAGELSGGQRRKLSVAIAFMGDPAVVFLDEPTSGMDPYSRRFTWDVIRRHRSGSAIVLTTHSMEEADLLGDRVVILARGRVAAEGTGMELKAAYGVGYSLTLVMESRQQQQQQPASGTSSSGPQLIGPVAGPGAAAATAATTAATPAPSTDAAAAVMAAVRQHVPSAELLSAAGAEVVVRLPREAAAAFPALLRELDGPVGRSQLGVASYGLSLTTLEEVFLSITAAVDQQLDISATSADTSTSTAAAAAAAAAMPQNGSADRPAPAGSKSAAQHTAAAPEPQPRLPPPLHGWRLYGQQLRALVAKRALCARRDRLAVVTQLLVPLALVYLALWISSLQVREPSQSPLELSRAVALFGRPLVVSAAPAARNASEGCTPAAAAARLADSGSAGAGAGGGCLAAFLGGHPGGGAAVDSGATALFAGDPRVRPSTLEAFLLKEWYRGPVYDAIHITGLPPPAAFAAAAAGGAAAAGASPALSFVLLTNQSAVSALPAALSEAMSAALSYVQSGTVQPPTQPPEPVEPQPPAGRHRSIVAAGGTRRTLIASTASRLETKTGTGDATDVAPSHRDGDSTASTIAAAAPSAARSASRPQPPPPVAFSAVSWPMPTLVSEPVVRVQRDAASLMLVLCLVLASSVLSASFVVFLVREQDNNSKHLQLVSGAPATAYWAANYVWDLLSYSASAGGLLALIAAYRLPQYTGQRLAASAGLLWGFGPAGISLTYLLHFLFRDEMRALQRLNTAYFLSGYLGFVVTWICDLIELLVPRPGALHRWNAGAKWALRTASPHYCFARGMYDVQSTYDSGFPFGKRGKAFDWDVYGSPMAHMAAQTLVYGGLAVLYDTGLFTMVYARLQDMVWAAAAGLVRWRQQQRRRRGSDGHPELDADRLLALEEGRAAAWRRRFGWPPRHPPAGSADGEAGAGAASDDEDEDVREEHLAVVEGRRRGSQVLLDGVKKSYGQGLLRPPVAAVRGLWVGVPPGECFGLLGVNGAGKTTTFRMLTGEVLPDAGDARVGGCSVRTHLAAARRQLGYCPQFEALPGAMTGREVVAMYARLRGVQECRVGPLVAQLLGRLGLQAAADSPCGGYSGGMKRKLGVAVALVGDPRVCALDEPSTGMDPGARRGLWECLQSEVIGAGRTVILTSHSMEECEALCTRLTIMVAGRLKCLGTVQHLKGRFGGGYVLEIKTLPRSTSMPSVPTAAGPAATGAAATGQTHTGAAPASLAPLAYSETAARLSAWVESVCPGAVLKQVDQNRFIFSIPRLAATSLAAADGSPALLPAAAADGPPPPRTDLAALFEAVETQRTSLGVVDYCLTQTTLEQVFVSMARDAAAAGHEAHHEEHRM